MTPRSFFHTLGLDDKCKLLMRPIWAMPEGGGDLDSSEHIEFKQIISKIDFLILAFPLTWIVV